MTKHQALQSHLYSEIRALRKELRDIDSRIEQLQRERYEVGRELQQFPDDDTIEEASYQELAGDVELHGIEVPDHLLMDDYYDDGNADVSAEVNE